MAGDVERHRKQNAIDAAGQAGWGIGIDPWSVRVGSVLWA
jgi:hypothetical protein